MASSFAGLAGCGHDPIHRSDRAQVAAVVEEPSPDLRRGEITELGRTDHRQNLVAFGVGQLVRRRGPRAGWAVERAETAPVDRRPRCAQQDARGLQR